MYNVSALVTAFNQSTFGQTVAQISAQDNVIGAVASVFFSRPGVVFGLGIFAYKAGSVFVGLHATHTTGKKGWEKIKVYFSNTEVGVKKILSGAAALAFTVATVYAATRRAF